MFENVTWVGVPLLSPGRSLKTDPNGVKNDVKIKLRVDKPYKQYETVSSDKILDKNQSLVIGNSYVVAYVNTSNTNPIASWGGYPITHNGIIYAPGEQFVASNSSFTSSSSAARVIEYSSSKNNSFNPTYLFNTNDIVADKSNINVAVNAMDKINVVPNPYYGYSSYETNQLDNRIKITNLPKRATISVFTVSGTLVKKIKKDDNISSVDWDLKNDFGIPIASGLYIIHVRGFLWDSSKGEYVEKDKVIKWFGALRPIDLDTF